MAHNLWDTYVEGFLTTSQISDVAILSPGGLIMSSSKGFELSGDEKKDIISFFTKAPEAIEISQPKKADAKITEPEPKTSVRLAGEKYFKLRTEVDEISHEKTILFRKGSDGAFLVMAKTVIIVAVYKEPVQAQEALAVILHYATHLRSVKDESK